MKQSHAAPPTTRTISRQEGVLRCPYLQTNVRWPIPVDQRLNELVSVLGAVGLSVTRSHLVAALVASAPTGLAELQQVVQTYGLKSAGAIVLQSRGPIEIPERRPGRRTEA